MSHLDRVSKAFLIFSGSNPRAVVAFCRELSAMDLDICIVARTRSDLILKTRYQNNVLAIREQDRLDLPDIDRCIREAKTAAGVSQFVICPSSEFLNAFLLRNRGLLEERGCEIPLVDMKTYESISNKYTSSRLCSQHGIAIPAEFQDYSGLDFPFVARPYKNINRESKSLYPYLIYDETDLHDFLSSEKREDFYFQEYVSGESHYLLFYFARSGRVFSFSQQNLIQQAGGKSIVLAWPSDIHRQGIADRFVHLFKSLGFYGLVMVEVIKRGEEFVFIELNPRFWGPFQLLRGAGSDILKAFICDWLGLDDGDLAEQRGRESAGYLWLNGLLATVLFGHQLKWHVDPGQIPARISLVARHLHNDVYLRPDTLALYAYELYNILQDARRERRKRSRSEND